MHRCRPPWTFSSYSFMSSPFLSLLSPSSAYIMSTFFLTQLFIFTGAVEPRLECLPDALRLHVTPETEFSGHVYVKGYFQSPTCHMSFTTTPTNLSFSFHIPYRSDCNVQRKRMLSPEGISYQVTVVVQNHRLFVTAQDQAFSLNCFYQQTTPVLEQTINVNDLTEETVVGEAPMTECRYDVLADSINGPRVRFSRVGEKIVHRWTCDSPEGGFLVHSCEVRDDTGTAFALLDERGCPVEPSLLPSLTYSNDMTVAFAEVSAFKFADQIAVHFACKITLCRRNENGCEGISPPICDLPPGQSSATTSPPGITPPVATQATLLLSGTAHPNGSSWTLEGNVASDSISLRRVQKHPEAATRLPEGEDDDLTRKPPPPTPTFQRSPNMLESREHVDDLPRPISAKIFRAERGRKRRSIPAVMIQGNGTATKRTLRTFDINAAQLFILGKEDSIDRDSMERAPTSYAPQTAPQSPYAQAQLCSQVFSIQLIVIFVFIALQGLSFLVIFCQRRYYKLRLSGTFKPNNNLDLTD